jgi:hypothetical protein
MPNVMTTSGPAGEVIDVLTSGEGSVRLKSVAMPFATLAFPVVDDDGIVAGNAVVSHVVAVAGILSTDKILGVNVPVAGNGSGLVVSAAVNGAGSLQLSYKNVKTTGETNGSTTYTVFVAR